MAADPPDTGSASPTSAGPGAGSAPPGGGGATAHDGAAQATPDVTTSHDGAVEAGETMPYPEHRQADVVLSDGGTVHIRPIRPDDADAIVALHSRFSDRTRYLRYFSPYPRIPARDLKRFTEVDHAGREALVAVLGNDLIAVGRYEQLSDPDTAEVAFVVEDAHQGRGIASVMLEHLAEAAREEGITRFVAEILPQNGAMIRVFTDAGYDVDRSFADGVVHLTFDTRETPQVLEVLHDRERRTEARSIRRLMNPSAVAVVGVSRTPDGMGRAVFENIRAAGFAGALHPVNPSATEIDGVPAHASVRDIPGQVDLAVIAVPAERVLAVVEDCAAKQVAGLVILTSGFAETGEEGAHAQARLVEMARINGMRVIGPNCFGLANTDPAVSLNATLAPHVPGRGRVGFFTQSGALGIALLAEVERRGLGISTFASAGNRADVSGNDLLQYWRDDPATDVVMMYLETFGNPRKFTRVARGLARRKPVVVLKSRGVTPGLTGGPGERGLQALYRASGVIRAEALGEMFNIGQLLAYQPLPTGRRTAVIGNSAVLVALATDACEANRLEVPLDWRVDVGPNVTPDELRAALRSAVDATDIDAVLVVFVPALAVPESAYADVLREVGADARIPVIASFLAANGMPERLRRLVPVSASAPLAPPDADQAAVAVTPAATGFDPDRTVLLPSQEFMVARGSVPSYATPEAAARTLGKVATYAEWRSTPAGQVPSLPDIDPGGARTIVGRTVDRHPEGVDLEDNEAAELLAAYGITVWPSRRVVGADAVVAAATELGFPVAVKAADETLRHRADLGTVRLDVDSPRDAWAAYHGIAAASGNPSPTVLVQRMARGGVVCVVEVVQDTAFGPVVGFGLGGIATELIGDRAWRAAPLTDRDAADLLREPLASPMLFGYRGARPVDAAACEDLLLRVGALADELPSLRALTLNPVLASPEGITVLHSTVRVERAAGPRLDEGARRLR
ncbi:bifunctional GNAT family N-acetyltransferase/acetate--CoA ligase family protein [Cryptosporangium arvum]|uniref:bifunctional acetate--CoA ligase family protein/GNAT family N-acetyltransferase n=1 Tax=Cryptosporangium arvum TaxID=80871 RepID=UPI0004BAFB3F|nr:bifunctional GNAT family N-acetyltransferase/acetate--CoA ligase family protein [Cryptosporangium arvum]